jgi:hypothetical protein
LERANQPTLFISEGRGFALASFGSAENPHT